MPTPRCQAAPWIPLSAARIAASLEWTSVEPAEVAIASPANARTMARIPVSAPARRHVVDDMGRRYARPAWLSSEHGGTRLHLEAEVRRAMVHP